MSHASDTEPDATEFSDALDVMYNVYKNIKYQKIKDILLRDMKKDVCDFIQNEIRQKINLYSQAEHQILVDKRYKNCIDKRKEKSALVLGPETFFTLQISVTRICKFFWCIFTDISSFSRSLKERFDLLV